MCMTCMSQAPAMTSSLSALAPYGVAAAAAAGLALRRPHRPSSPQDEGGEPDLDAATANGPEAPGG